MSSTEESNTIVDFIEYMADVHVSIPSEDDADEIEIINELVNLDDNHRCDLCCGGEFLIDRLLRFGGLINETYKFVCDKCDKNFVSKSELKKHSLCCPGPISEQNKTINGENSPSRKRASVLYSIVCTVCQKSFRSKSGLTRHMQCKHSGLTYKCELCQEVFSEFKKFNIHCSKHQKSKNMFVCSKCDKRFCSNVKLEKHLKKHKPDSSGIFQEPFLKVTLPYCDSFVTI